MVRKAQKAEEKYGKAFIHDCKAVLRVGKLFLLYPIFWALYDQQVCTY